MTHQKLNLFRWLMKFLELRRRLMNRNFVQKFEDVNLTENNQHKAASLPGSPIVKVSECLRSTQSQGGHQF